MVDLGARENLDTELLDIAKYVDAIGFEPDEQECERLSQSGSSLWKSVTFIPFAVASNNGVSDLYLTDSPESASLRPHNAGLVEEFGFDNMHVDKRKVPVKSLTLNALLEKAYFPRVDYLKVDIEGAELEVLQAGDKVMRDVAALKVECSFLEQRIDQALIWDVAQYLVRDGFNIVELRDIRSWRRRPVAAHPYISNATIPYSRGRIAQCDLIALKKSDWCRNEQQALRIAICSAAMGYFDYSLHVIRCNPMIADSLTSSLGIDVYELLAEWSKAAGEVTVRNALSSHLRSAVPLLKSMFGSIRAPESLRRV